MNLFPIGLVIAGVDRFDQLSDSALMARIAVGEEAAVAPLMAMYERPLFSLLIRLSSGRSEAEDLFQETWIRVLRSAGAYDPALPFRPWLFKIAWNVARTALQRARPAEALDAAGLVESRGDHPADQMIRAQRDERIRRVVAGLPRHLAETILLRYFEELTEREVASRLSIPVGTVKSRIHTALRRLAVALHEEPA